MPVPLQFLMRFGLSYERMIRNPLSILILPDTQNKIVSEDEAYESLFLILRQQLRLHGITYKMLA